MAEQRLGSKPHWPALDGLRAVAVIGVILYHVGVLPGGYLGVDVFFVLSGFLITTLLLREWVALGSRVSFRDFYARRVLRLFPALACVIAAALVLAGILALTGSANRAYAWTTVRAVPWVLAFSGNWVRALEPPLPIGSLGALGQTWSLAVEEQFYLLWPTLFVLVMRRGISQRKLALVLTLLGVTEMICRTWLARFGYSQDRIYYATDTHSDGLLIGCALAFWVGGRTAESKTTKSSDGKVTWLAAAILTALFVAGSWSSSSTESSVAVLASAVLILGVVTGRTPAALLRLLSARNAVVVGRRSYGLYLWQYVLLAAAQALAARSAGFSEAGPWYSRIAFASIMVAGMAATFFLAEMSYRLVEIPALRMKRRFEATVEARELIASDFADTGGC